MLRARALRRLALTMRPSAEVPSVVNHPAEVAVAAHEDAAGACGGQSARHSLPFGPSRRALPRLLTLTLAPPRRHSLSPGRHQDGDGCGAGCALPPRAHARLRRVPSRLRAHPEGVSAHAARSSAPMCMRLQIVRRN